MVTQQSIVSPYCITIPFLYNTYNKSSCYILHCCNVVYIILFISFIQIVQVEKHPIVIKLIFYTQLTKREYQIEQTTLIEHNHLYNKRISHHSFIHLTELSNYFANLFIIILNLFVNSQFVVLQSN